MSFGVGVSADEVEEFIVLDGHPHRRAGQETDYRSLLPSKQRALLCLMVFCCQIKKSEI
jgi:hypothetical protein